MKTFVEDLGIKVIATTHSASTVAFAPEDAIYIMEGGDNGLRKATKDEAIRDLTSGVPTLSFDYTGRRQVLVEGKSDENIYPAVYLHTKKFNKSDRSLDFIAVGVSRDSGGDLPKFTSLRLHLAAAYSEAGKPDQAREEIAAVLEIAPGYRLSMAAENYPYVEGEMHRLTTDRAKIAILK